jgi:hypothetical protein
MEGKLHLIMVGPVQDPDPVYANLLQDAHKLAPLLDELGKREPELEYLTGGDLLAQAYRIADLLFANGVLAIPAWSVGGCAFAVMEGCGMFRLNRTFYEIAQPPSIQYEDVLDSVRRIEASEKVPDFPVFESFLFCLSGPELQAELTRLRSGHHTRAPASFRGFLGFG